MPIFCQRGSGALCFPGFGSAHRLCRAAGLGVFLLSGLPHPGAAFLPDAHCGRFSLFGGVSAAGWLAAAPGRGVPGVVLCPNAAVLFQQYGHHQRCHLNHLCALHPAGYPRGKPKRLCPLPCGVRDDRRQPGKHGHPHRQPPEPLSLFRGGYGLCPVCMGRAALYGDFPGAAGGGSAVSKRGAGPGVCLPGARGEVVLTAPAGNAVLPGLVLAGGVPGGGLPPGAGVCSPGDPFGGPAALWGGGLCPAPHLPVFFHLRGQYQAPSGGQQPAAKLGGQASLQAKSSAMCLLPFSFPASPAAMAFCLQP